MIKLSFLKDEHIILNMVKVYEMSYVKNKKSTCKQKEA